MKSNSIYAIFFLSLLCHTAYGAEAGSHELASAAQLALFSSERGREVQSQITKCIALIEPAVEHCTKIVAAKNCTLMCTPQTEHAADDYYHYLTFTIKDATNNEIGYVTLNLRFFPARKTELHMSRLKTKSIFRRKGVATDLYRLARHCADCLSMVLVWTAKPLRPLDGEDDSDALPFEDLITFYQKHGGEMEECNDELEVAYFRYVPVALKNSAAAATAI